jgi:hypothetical protein
MTSDSGKNTLSSPYKPGQKTPSAAPTTPRSTSNSGTNNFSSPQKSDARAYTQQYIDSDLRNPARDGHGDVNHYAPHPASPYAATGTYSNVLHTQGYTKSPARPQNNSGYTPTRKGAESAFPEPKSHTSPSSRAQDSLGYASTRRAAAENGVPQLQSSTSLSSRQHDCSGYTPIRRAAAENSFAQTQSTTSLSSRPQDSPGYTRRAAAENSFPQAQSNTSLSSRPQDSPDYTPTRRGADTSYSDGYVDYSEGPASGHSQSIKDISGGPRDNKDIREGARGNKPGSTDAHRRGTGGVVRELYGNSADVNGNKPASDSDRTSTGGFEPELSGGNADVNANRPASDLRETDMGRSRPVVDVTGLDKYKEYMHGAYVDERTAPCPSHEGTVHGLEQSVRGDGMHKDAYADRGTAPYPSHADIVHGLEQSVRGEDDPGAAMVEANMQHACYDEHVQGDTYAQTPSDTYAMEEVTTPRHVYAGTNSANSHGHHAHDDDVGAYTALPQSHDQTQNAHDDDVGAFTALPQSDYQTQNPDTNHSNQSPHSGGYNLNGTGTLLLSQVQGGDGYSQARDVDSAPREGVDSINRTDLFLPSQVHGDGYSQARDADSVPRADANGVVQDRSHTKLDVAVSIPENTESNTGHPVKNTGSTADSIHTPMDGSIHASSSAAAHADAIPNTYTCPPSPTPPPGAPPEDGRTWRRGNNRGRVQPRVHGYASSTASLDSSMASYDGPMSHLDASAIMRMDSSAIALSPASVGGGDAAAWGVMEHVPRLSESESESVSVSESEERRGENGKGKSGGDGGGGDVTRTLPPAGVLKKAVC